MNREICSGMMLTLLLGGMLLLAFNIQSVGAWTGGTVVIEADGSVSPWDAPISTVDNVTYTFTADIESVGIFDGINIERDNIVIDGAGNTLLEASGIKRKAIRFTRWIASISSVLSARTSFITTHSTIL